MTKENIGHVGGPQGKSHVAFSSSCLARGQKDQGEAGTMIKSL